MFLSSSGFPSSMAREQFETFVAVVFGFSRLFPVNKKTPKRD